MNPEEQGKLATDVCSLFDRDLTFCIQEVSFSTSVNLILLFDHHLQDFLWTFLLFLFVSLRSDKRKV